MCREEPGKKHVYSKRQKRFFGAVAGGHPTIPTTMTAEQAKHHIRMSEKEGGSLPEHSNKLYKRKNKK